MAEGLLCLAYQSFAHFDAGDMCGTLLQSGERPAPVVAADVQNATATDQVPVPLNEDVVAPIQPFWFDANATGQEKPWEFRKEIHLVRAQARTLPGLYAQLG